MSQKGEKYARRMERRVDKLEQDVAAITTEQTTQGVRISAVEDDLAVYRAAVSARELKQAAAEIKAAKERRTARAAERERKARRRNKVLAFIALALFVAVCVVMVAKAYSEEPAAEPTAPEASAAPAVPTMRRSRRPRGWTPPPPPGISRAAATSWACIWPSMATSKRPPWPTTWARAAREAHGTAGSPPPTTPRQSRRPWKHGNVR